MAARQFDIEVPAPFRLDLTAWALRRRAHNLLDAWDGKSWRRALATEDGALGVTVTQAGASTDPRLVVTVEPTKKAPLSRRAVVDARQMVTRVLGLELDIRPFYALADRDPRLAALAERFRGMRPPRFSSVFEALVNAIACQQLSLDVGIHLLNRLAARLGSPPAGSHVPSSLPSPDRLAGADVEELRMLGFSRSKAATLVSVGQMVVSDEIDLEALHALDDVEARDVLVGLRGIGRWSAEYTLLRGLGRLEVLPGDDVGAQNNLRRRFGLAAGAGYDAVGELSAKWRPYAGLVYFHLLLDQLADGGYVQTSCGTEPTAP